MYVPKHFAELRPRILQQFIRAFPFGTLTTMTPLGLEANHIPFVLKTDPPPYGTLQGHLARANSQWENFHPDVEALVTFLGPDAYISPSWYPTKQATGKAVPTWNYVTVHVYGRLRVTEDEEWLLRHVEQLTNQHEGGRADPWRVSDAPADYTSRLLRAIVGVEVDVTRLVGKWKLGQNRPIKDQEGIELGLSAQGEESAPSLLTLLRTRELE